MTKDDIEEAFADLITECFVNNMGNEALTLQAVRGLMLDNFDCSPSMDLTGFEEDMNNLKGLTIRGLNNDKS